MKMETLFYGLCMTALMNAGCAGRPESAPERSYSKVGDTVYVEPSGTLSEKIRTHTVHRQPFVRQVVTAGTIQPISTQYAYIAPPFAGRVTRSYIRLGQWVAANAPMFEIVCPDFVEAQKDFYQAQSDRDLALKDKLRKEDLFKNGVASERELEESDNQLRIAEKEFENATAALRIYHVDPDNMFLGQPLVIRSPLAGNIIENNIVVGQYLKDDAEPVAIVADVTKVWVTAQVKEKDLRFVNEGDDLEIDLPAYPGQTISGKVFHVDEAVDEETRSIKVLSECLNQDEMLKLGMYVTVRFKNAPVDTEIVPEKALLQDEDMTYVYVETSENAYVRRPVEVEIVREGMAIVSSGLREGDVVICEGGYFLK